MPLFRLEGLERLVPTARRQFRSALTYEDRALGIRLDVPPEPGQVLQVTAWCVGQG
jgi:hypothetical protein